MSEAALLAQLDWKPTLAEINEASESQLQYLLICKEVLNVARFGGKLDL